MLDITEDIAEAFDLIREEVGPVGTLLLLGYSAGEEGEHQLAEIENGWSVDTIYDPGIGQKVFRVQIVEQSLITPEVANEWSRLRFDGITVEIMKPVQPPFKEPRVWKIRARILETGGLP
ncbi:MAG: hypothetical protein ACR2LC_09675 [Pyrinomonadaceae bacterium]